MKSMRLTRTLAVATFAAGCLVVVAVIIEHRTPRQSTRGNPAVAPGENSMNTTGLQAPELPAPKSNPVSPQINPEIQLSKQAGFTNVAPATEPAQTDRSLQYNGYEVLDPLARVALYSVGDDPDATDYWTEAINDPTLPAEERKDLIEDLNESGLSDPEHPTLADLPLIESRIELIEEMAPYAMDQVNGDAFMEAYTDLIDLLNGKAPR